MRNNKSSSRNSKNSKKNTDSKLGSKSKKNAAYFNKIDSKKTSNKSKIALPKFDGLTRLNKYIANAGVCSRRDADVLINSGVISVNGQTVTELGYKVKEGDVVRYGDQKLSHEKKVYFVLNKPKNFNTVLTDDKTEKSVMNLIKGASKQQVYPVGKLDKMSTGILLFTNDSDLSMKLSHPKFKVHKVYHLHVDKKVAKDDMESISTGITMEEGFFKADKIAYVGKNEDDLDKKQIGLELTSGKTNNIKRAFSHLGYEVLKLDRISFGAITKKNLPRGQWRVLTESEVDFLKMLK